MHYGDNVALPVPAVDRGKCDPKNMLGVIIAKTADENFKIGVKAGTLKGTYSRNSFALCARKHISPDDIPNKSVSLREATKILPSGGQGFFHCECKKSGKRCENNRCKCFKNKRICNSRCHNTDTCKNK